MTIVYNQISEPSKTEIIIVKNTKNSTFGHFKSVLHILFQLFFLILLHILVFLILSQVLLSYLICWSSIT